MIQLRLSKGKECKYKTNKHRLANNINMYPQKGNTKAILRFYLGTRSLAYTMSIFPSTQSHKNTRKLLNQQKKKKKDKNLTLVGL